jgi:hypothetical protein
VNQDCRVESSYKTHTRSFAFCVRAQGVLLLTKEAREDSDDSSNNASEDSDIDNSQQLYIQARAHISRTTVHPHIIPAQDASPSSRSHSSLSFP